MKSSTFSRVSYRLILRIHPRPFRERFADEMLWIFDEESRRGAASRLLWDGVLSLLRQHAKSDDNPEPTATGFGMLITNPGISPLRFVQAGLTASILLRGFIFAYGSQTSLSFRSDFQELHIAPHSGFRHLCALNPSP